MNSDFSQLTTSTTRQKAGGTDFNRQSRKTLLIASLIAFVLLFLPYADLVLYPLRLFVTFVHESGHAISAIATGGGVESLRVMPNGEGVTMVRVSPLWAWISLSGGYLGTAVFGALMLQVGRLRNVNPLYRGKAALFAAAVAIGLITLLWGFHPTQDLFTPAVGGSLAVLLFVAAKFLSPKIADFFAAFLAVQCGLNALGDIRILLHLTTAGSAHNDAGFMAQQYGLPPTFWAVSWAIMAALILGVSLRSYLRATETKRAAGPLL